MGLSDSESRKPPLRSMLCHRPSSFTPSSGAASPARNRCAASGSTPVGKDQVVMNFIAVVLHFVFSFGGIFPGPSRAHESYRKSVQATRRQNCRDSSQMHAQPLFI